MPFGISNVSLLNTFDFWLQRTNEALDFITSKAVSVNTAAAVGTAYITGALRANSLYANGIAGGNSSVVSNLVITSTNTALIGNVNITGLTSITGNLSVSNVTIANTLNIGNITITTNNKTLSTNSATQSVIDSFPTSAARTIKYLTQSTDSTNLLYRASEILLVHNGSSVFKTEYSVINSNTDFATFDADISGGVVRLLFTPTNATTSTKTIKVSRQTISN